MGEYLAIKFLMDALKHRLPANQWRLVKQEVKRIAPEIMEDTAKKILTTTLYLLHSNYGWGKKRLHDFWVEYDKFYEELLKYYQLSTDDAGWLCEQKLKDIGVDVDEWIREDSIRAETIEEMGGCGN